VTIFSTLKASFAHRQPSATKPAIELVTVLGADATRGHLDVGQASQGIQHLRSTRPPLLDAVDIVDRRY
jgi:hypothetical protein